MAAESGGMPEMAIASSIDLKNPLPENIATGPQYLEALGRLGFNAENLQSNLPFAVNTMNAASSLITNQYKQQMEYQKSQADLAEAMARARQTDSVTKWNNDSLQLRLNALAGENKVRDLDIAKRTNDNQLQAATLADAIAQEHQKTQLAGLLTDQARIKRDEAQKAYDNSSEALADQEAALSALPAYDSPDFDNELNKAFIAHNRFATDPATAKIWADNVNELTQRRSHLSSVIDQNNQTNQLLGHLEKGHIPSSVRGQLDALRTDPAMTHAWNARGNLAETNSDISSTLGILNALEPATRQSPQVQAYVAQLTAARDRINALLQNDDVVRDLAMNKHSPDFDADGKISPELQTDLDGLKMEALRLKALEKKPSELTIYAPARADALPGEKQDSTKIYLNGEETPEQIQAFRDMYQPRKAAQQEAQKAAQRKLPPGFRGQMVQQAIEAGGGETMAIPFGLFAQPPARPTAQTPANVVQNQWADRLNALQRADPTMKAVVDKLINGTPQEKAAAANAIQQRLERGMPPAGFQYGGLIGTQTGLMKQGGGMIFNPSQVGAGSTDTVPLMATPGEYVVRQPVASSQGTAAMDALNSGQATIVPISSSPNIGNVAGAIAQGIRTAQRQPTAGKDAAQPTTQPTSQTVTPWWGGKNVTPWWGGSAQPQQPTSVSQPSTADIVPATVGAIAAGPVEPGPMGAPGGMFLNPATGSYEPLQTDAASSGIPIGQTVDGAALTRFGYPGDSSWDPDSGKGMGDRDNLLQGGFSAALTQSMRKQLFPDAKVNPKTGLTSSTGRTFQWGGRTYRDDDSTSSAISGNRIDVYDPYYTGLDKGVTQQMAASRRKLMPQYAQAGAAPGQRPTATGARPTETEPTAEGYLRYAAAHPGTTMDQYEQLFTQAQGFQRGGLVSEEGSIGTRGEGGFGGGRGGGIEGELDAPVDPRQRHRRFHPRVGAAGQLGMGADIPDPMQKKLAKLSQDFLGGLSDLIKARPEMGPQLLRHARNQLAANMGGQPEDWTGMGGGAGESQQMRQVSPGIPPEAYGGGMTAYGGREGEESGSAYMRGGGMVGYQGGGQVAGTSYEPWAVQQARIQDVAGGRISPDIQDQLYQEHRRATAKAGRPAAYMQAGGMVGGAPAFPEDIMNQALLDPEGFGLGYMQRGGPVQPRMSNLLTAAHQGLYR